MEEMRANFEGTNPPGTSEQEIQALLNAFADDKAQLPPFPQGKQIGDDWIKAFNSLSSGQQPS